MPRKVALPDLDDVIQRYRAGESLNALADELGVARKTLKRHLLTAGVEVRGRRGAVAAKMATLTPAEHAAWLDRLTAGPAALRGTRYTEQRLAQHAIGRAGCERWITDEERLLAGWLPAAVVVEHQPAVGRYNADLLLDRHVAVEVQRSDHTSTHRERWRFLHRLDDMLNMGQHVAVVLWNDAIVLHPAVAQELIAFLKTASGRPASRGEHRVVWGDAKYLSRGDHDLDELARIWPTKAASRSRPADARRP